MISGESLASGNSAEIGNGRSEVATDRHSRNATQQQLHCPLVSSSGFSPTLTNCQPKRPLMQR